MNEREKANQFAKIVDQQLQGSQKPTSVGDEEVEDMVSFAKTLHTTMQTGRNKEIYMRQKLDQIAQKATPQFARQQNRRVFSSKLFNLVGTAAFILLVGVGLFWAVQTLNPNPPLPAAAPISSTPLPTAVPGQPTLTPVDSPPPTPQLEIIPASQSLVADACQISPEETGINKNLLYTWAPEGFPGDQKVPEGFVGGGAVQTGDWSFNIWLVCDSQFQRELTQPTNLNQLSDIDGLGLFTTWEYDHNAPDMAGFYTAYAGFEPFVKETGGGSPITGGFTGSNTNGFIPAYGILPDFSQQDTPLRYVQYVELPNGIREGAALTFTLQRESEGYRPVNIQIHLLTQDEIEATKNLSSDDLPFATLNVLDAIAPMQPIVSLMTEWQAQLLQNPGWIYSQRIVEDSDGNGIIAGLTNYTDEHWMYINQDGLIEKDMTIQTASDGRIIQESVSANGVIHNYTSAMEYPYEPVRFDVVRDRMNAYLSMTRTGKNLQPQLTTWQGHSAWMIETASDFDPPMNVDNNPAKTLLSREYIDAKSGQPLGFETILIDPEGVESLQQRYYQKTYQAVDTPPPNALELLSRQIGTYQPAPPYGKPAPTNFDPAGLALYLHSQPGDQMDRPTFWFGDLSAGEYLLGRVDFGGVPGGGWSTCTDQGDKLAFLYHIDHSDSSVDSRLRWFNLHDVTQVFDPIPDKQVHSVPAWSPDGKTLAFFACEDGQIDCGLYLLAAETNTTRLLSTTGHSVWPLLWKPDNKQIAFVDTQTNVHTLFVLDVTSGEIIEESLFDADLWQPPAGSFVNEWGVKFPREYVGNCYAN